MKDIKCGVYALYFEKADKVYVGQSSNIQNRFNSHLSTLRRDVHSNYKLQQAYNTDNNVELVILQQCRIEELDVVEQYWMDQFEVIKYGCNLESVAANPAKSGGQFETKLAKYSRETILELFELLLDSKNSREFLSKKFGMPLSYVSRIAHGHRHSWLANDYPDKWVKVQEANLVRAKSDNVSNGNMYPKYTIMDPSNVLHTVIHITDFAKKHGLSPNLLGQMLLGNISHHRNWVLVDKTIERLE